MAMVSADGSSQSFGGHTAQIGWFGLRVGGHPVLSLHSSNEPSELSQWLCHDDSTINIVVVIIIIIIIIKPETETKIRSAVCIINANVLFLAQIIIYKIPFFVKLLNFW